MDATRRLWAVESISFRQLLLCFALLVCPSLSAAPVFWTVYGTMFSDGGIVFGSFVFDDDLDQFSDIAITTTDTATATGTTYSFFHPGYPMNSGNPTLYLVDSNAANLTGARFFLLIPGAPLTNAGGTFGNVSVEEWTCVNAECKSFQVVRNTYSGAVKGFVSSIPEPNSVLLAGLGLAVLLARIRKEPRRRIR